jgi:hypothetical protein
VVTVVSSLTPYHVTDAHVCLDIADGEVTCAAAESGNQGAPVYGLCTVARSAKFARWQTGWLRLEGYRAGLMLSPEEHGNIVRRIEFRGRIAGWLAGFVSGSF